MALALKTSDYQNWIPVDFVFRYPAVSPISMYQVRDNSDYSNILLSLDNTNWKVILKQLGSKSIGSTHATGVVSNLRSLHYLCFSFILANIET